LVFLRVPLVPFVVKALNKVIHAANLKKRICGVILLPILKTPDRRYPKVKVRMLTQKISFPNEQALCVFPNQLDNLPQALTTLGLKTAYPVIVLIGGEIQEQQAQVTSEALETLAQVAEALGALVICGGTDMGVMAEIGQVRQLKGYQFPLVGITLAALATWPDGPQSLKFLWWGTKRWDLAQHYSHFILVPGTEFGDESPWIVAAATLLSTGQRSVTVLMNGGNVSRKDIELSLSHSRPVIALGGTGRLANELATEPKQDLITVVPANSAERMRSALRAALAAT
jgi:hypothetical protein